MSKPNNDKEPLPPPAYGSQSPLHDAGPVPVSPYNEYGGFASSANPADSRPAQAHLDPRNGAPHQYSSPAPIAPGYQSPMPYAGHMMQHPPNAYYPNQSQGYYGQQHGMQYAHNPGYYGNGPAQGGYYSGGGGAYYGGEGYHQRGYRDDRGAGGEGICAGLLGAMACCCCLDLLIF